MYIWKILSYLPCCRADFANISSNMKKYNLIIWWYTWMIDFYYWMDINKKYKQFLFMNTYFITQVFLFVHFITNKLHCSLFADHNIQFQNIAFRQHNYAGYAFIFLIFRGQSTSVSGHTSYIPKKLWKWSLTLAIRLILQQPQLQISDLGSRELKLTSQYNNTLKSSRPHRQLQLTLLILAQHINKGTHTAM